MKKIKLYKKIGLLKNRRLNNNEFFSSKKQIKKVFMLGLKKLTKLNLNPLISKTSFLKINLKKLYFIYVSENL